MSDPEARPQSKSSLSEAQRQLVEQLVEELVEEAFRPYHEAEFFDDDEEEEHDDDDDSDGQHRPAEGAEATPPPVVEPPDGVETFVLAASTEDAEDLHLRLVRIPGGEHPFGDRGPFGFDGIRSIARLTRSFAIGEVQVTQALFERIMGFNPSRFAEEPRAPQHPVESVSWFQAVEFLNRLSVLLGLDPAYTVCGDDVQCDFDASGFRLPTEAEWEIAARASTDLFDFAGSDDRHAVAHMCDATVLLWGGSTKPVGTLQPNRWGFFDMSGNVSEWLWDVYLPLAYGMEPIGGDWQTAMVFGAGPVVDPVGPPPGARPGVLKRALRGGGWTHGILDGRYACLDERMGARPDTQSDAVGFRLARTLS